MLLDSDCRLLLKARGVALGLMMAHAKGSSLAAMAPRSRGLQEGCLHAAVLVRVGAEGVGAAGQPWCLSHPRWGRGLKGAGLGGEWGQKRWRKGGGWCFPAHVDSDLSLGKTTCFYSHRRWLLPSAEAPCQTLQCLSMRWWAAWLAQLIAEPHEWDPAAPVLPLLRGNPSWLWVHPITLLPLSRQK